MSLIEFTELLQKIASESGVVSVKAFVNVDANGNLTEVSGNKIDLEVSITKQ